MGISADPVGVSAAAAASATAVSLPMDMPRGEADDGGGEGDADGGDADGGDGDSDPELERILEWVEYAPWNDLVVIGVSKYKLRWVHFFFFFKLLLLVLLFPSSPFKRRMHMIDFYFGSNMDVQPDPA